MHFLLLGLSRIARRRVIPALASLPSVTIVDVASRTATDLESLPARIRGRLFPDYSEALDRSGADVAYVSLVNSEHVRWARAALESGLHAIVDKPCATTVSEAAMLANLAEVRNKCLAEAVVFEHHPQAERCLALIREADAGPLRISATFSFPPMDPGDFRYQAQAAGGALLDLGPYAASTARWLFGRSPDQVSCRVLARKSNVDTAFSVMMTCEDGAALVGRFGFDTEYCNHISVIGRGISIDVDRIYTQAPDVENCLRVKRGNDVNDINIAAADSFRIFLEKFMAAARDGRSAAFLPALLADAELRERMSRSAMEEGR